MFVMKIEAFVRFLENHKDLRLAKKALKHMKSTKTLTQLRKELMENQSRDS